MNRQFVLGKEDAVHKAVVVITGPSDPWKTAAEIDGVNKKLICILDVPAVDDEGFLRVVPTSYSGKPVRGDVTKLIRKGVAVATPVAGHSLAVLYNETTHTPVLFRARASDDGRVVTTACRRLLQGEKAKSAEVSAYVIVDHNAEQAVLALEETILDVLAEQGVPEVSISTALTDGDPHNLVVVALV